MNDYFSSLLNTITKSLNSVDDNCFDSLLDECVSALKNGHKIIATGLGKNVPICEKFEGTMISLGLDARFMHTNSAAHGDLGMVREGDVVLILSKSGETIESLYLLDHLKDRNVCIWALTFNGESTLALNSPNALIMELDHEGDRWNIVPNNSTTLYLIILQALAIQLSDRMGTVLDDFRINHPGGAIGAKLNSKK